MAELTIQDVANYLDQQGYTRWTDLSLQKVLTEAGMWNCLQTNYNSAHVIDSRYITFPTVDLSAYATEAAMKSWVQSQGYLTSVPSPDLSGYATQQWVLTRGFLTTHQSLADYATITLLQQSVAGLASQTWVGNNYVSQQSFDELFEKVNIGTEQSPVYVIHAKLGLYSDSFITAGGVGTSGGGGGGGLSWENLASTVAAAGEQVNICHLTEALAGYATTSMLGGYALTSQLPTKLSDLTDDLGSSPTHTHSQYLTALPSHNHDSRYYISGGTVHLGSGSITPLTSHQSLAGYATTSQLAGYLPLSGGTLTGQLRVKAGSTVIGPSLDDTTYRYYHAVYFGTHGTDHLDFYEGEFNFYGNGGGKPTVKIGGYRVLDTSDAGSLSVAFATNSKHIEPLAYASSNGVGMTVAQVKSWIASQFDDIGCGVGSNVYVSADAICNWNDDSHTVVDSSVYSFMKIGGGYDGTRYGQWMLSSYNDNRVGFVGRSEYIWSNIQWIALLTDKVAAAYNADNADMVDGYHASAFARIQEPNNFIHSGNEFTFVSGSYSGMVWFNYRTASGIRDGNITDYYFGNGNGGTMAVISNQAITLGGCSISWDSSAQMLRFSTGIYSVGAVTAGGVGTSGGGGGGLSWANLSAATTEQINHSHLTTALSNYVTLTDAQTINGVKTFSSQLNVTGDYHIGDGSQENSWISANDIKIWGDYSLRFGLLDGSKQIYIEDGVNIAVTGNTDVNGYVTATGFKKTGYISSDYLLTGDGEAISKSTLLSGYATTSQLHSHSNKSTLDGITSTKVSHWDDAYGWGNHANYGYLTSLPTHYHDGRYYISGGTIYLAGRSITPLTSHQSLTNYVTLNGVQTITAKKTFNANIVIGSGKNITFGTSTIAIDSNSRLNFYGTGGIWLSADDHGIQTYEKITAGGFINNSDLRMKTLFGDVGLTVAEIATMPAVRFRWNEHDTETMNVGTIAQAWQTLLPEVVREGINGYLSMDYAATALVSTIVTARTVTDHEHRIKDLEAENERLKKEIELLKAV